MRIALIADLHLTAERTEGVWWNRMLFSRMDEVMESLVRRVNAVSPDLVIVLGDLTDTGRDTEFKRVRDALATFRAPVYVTLGNHDIFQDRSIAESVLGAERVSNQSIDAGPCTLAILDQGYWISDDGTAHGAADRSARESGRIVGCGCPDQALTWLAEIAGGTGNPVLVFTHFPLVLKRAYPMATSPLGDPVNKPLTSWMHFATYLSASRDDVLPVLYKHPDVRAVFSGHTHFHGAAVRGGVMHCSTASMCSYPFEFRSVTFANGAFEVETHGLDDPSFALESFNANWNNRWVTGAPEDRRFTFR